MIKDLLFKIREFPRLKLVIITLVVWQYLSIACIALLNWPISLVWLNLGLILGFILLCPVYESLLLVILSIPFYVVLPNTKLESFSMWRVIFLVLFFAWFVKEKKLLEIKSLSGLKKIKAFIFMPWDKYLAFFVVFGTLITLVFAKYKIQGIKHLIFLINIYLLYIVLVNTVKSKHQIFDLIRYTIWSLTIIVTLGFAQLFGTFITDLDTFWVFWAENITKLYYGSGFANVSLYSNSWFNYIGGRSLRMFSIMPDSQSFAYICIFGLCIGTALTRSVFTHVRKWLWSGIRFAALGLILSGTRAVWVGMLVPFFAVFVGYLANVQKHLAKKYLWPFIIIFILFAISPFINQGLSYFRVREFRENFLQRAQSIYNVNDVSNRGRIEIWKDSFIFALKNPLGVGFANFKVSLDPQNSHDSYEELSKHLNIRYNLPNKYVSAHNLYLHILVETGVVGLLVFCYFWLVIVRYLWHFVSNYKKTEDFLVYFVAQALIMVVWVMAASFFDITLFNDKVLMFFFVDLGLAGLVVKRYHEYHPE